MIKRISKKIKNKFFSKTQYLENRELHNLFKNKKRAFILGGAESINNLNLKFNNQEDFVISSSNFYEHKNINQINPDIHIFAASHPPLNDIVLTNWWTRCNEKLPLSTSLLIEKRDRKIAEKVFKGRKVYYYSYGGNFPVDFTKKILSPQSVTQVSIQLAIYCRLKEIFLVGVNHDWQCLKPYRHFYDHTKPSLEFYLAKENITIPYENKVKFPKERLYREYELFQIYESLNKEANKYNLNIFNADRNTDFDVFPFKFLKKLYT